MTIRCPVAVYLAPTTCPSCYWRGWVPVLRGVVEMARDADPETECLPARCGNRHCEVGDFPVTARDIARARPKDIAAQGLRRAGRAHNVDA